LAALLPQELLDKYQYPPMGPDHEKDSFNAQSQSLGVGKQLTSDEWEETLYRMEHCYKYSRWDLPDDFGEDSHIERIIELIMDRNPTKSPGAIFLRQGLQNNKSVLDKLGMAGLVSMVRDRWEALVVADMSLGYDPNVPNTSDPIRIFQKFEPHSLKKMMQKRYRLIFGVSLIDQIVDRMLLQGVVDSSLAACRLQSSKPGISFKKGGTDVLVRAHTSNRENWNSFDASGFDFSVTGNQLFIVAELNRRLCLTPNEVSPDMTPEQVKKVQRKEFWWMMYQKREQAINLATLVFSCGTMIRQLWACIVKSGRVTTIDGNCKISCSNRVRYDIRSDVATRPLDSITMGDDAVENNLARGAEDFISFVRDECGNRLEKQCETGPLIQQNFCSADITRLPNGKHVMMPCNFEKSAWRAAHVEVTKRASYPDTISNLCTEYAFHPKYDVFEQALRDVGDPARMLSRKSRQHVHTASE
jgi:hypothetical protein